MDTVDPLRFLIAFIFVLALIGVMALLLRRYGSRFKMGSAGLFAAKEESGRVTILETKYIDSRRRLVLIRRDDKEHLLLLADGREQVIESYPTKAS